MAVGSVSCHRPCLAQIWATGEEKHLLGIPSPCAPEKEERAVDAGHEACLRLEKLGARRALRGMEYHETMQGPSQEPQGLEGRSPRAALSLSL